jgi:adenine phosphoribosyltransferase
MKLATIASVMDVPNDGEAIIEAIKLVVADFDDRATNAVSGKGGQIFSFFPTAVTDNIPPLSHALSEAICLLARLHIEHAETATLGVGEEDRGAMIIADILRQYRLPRTLARWTPSGAPGEVAVGIANEYLAEGTTQLYLNGVRPGDKILLVDDLISTGGTLVALAQAITLAGGEVSEIFTIGEKTENKGRAFVAEKTALSVKTLLSTDLVDRGSGPRSRVTHVNLGRIDRHCFATVARHFPVGFCQCGSGADSANQCIAKGG